VVYWLAPVAERIDANGRAYKGSKLQTQIYVNRRAPELERSLTEKLRSLPPSARFRWVSPLEAQGFVEYQDADFLRAVGLEAHVSALAAIWPARGPVWDALAVIEIEGDRPGVLLAEGKSYPAELFGGGCQATEPARSRIADALARTQRGMDLPEEPERWMGRLYQTANRLAHLHWLRDQLGIRAWLAHLLFVDDPHAPTARTDWIAAVDAASAELGLTETSMPFAGHVLLDARDRQELLD
jgi:hypothetical protein